MRRRRFLKAALGALGALGAALLPLPRAIAVPAPEIPSMPKFVCWYRLEGKVASVSRQIELFGDECQVARNQLGELDVALRAVPCRRCGDVLCHCDEPDYGDGDLDDWASVDCMYEVDDEIAIIRPIWAKGAQFDD